MAERGAGGAGQNATRVEAVCTTAASCFAAGEHPRHGWLRVLGALSVATQAGSSPGDLGANPSCRRLDPHELAVGIKHPNQVTLIDPEVSHETQVARTVVKQSAWIAGL